MPPNEYKYSAHGFSSLGSQTGATRCAITVKTITVSLMFYFSYYYFSFWEKERERGGWRSPGRLQAQHRARCGA